MKKSSVLLFLLCLFYLSKAQTNIDTSGGHYFNEIFTNVNITTNIPYGSADTYSGTTQALSLDVYEPDGDTTSFRPLIVFAHGGSFISGTKNDQDITTICTRFAKMGYVCASIDYRLGLGLPVDSIRAARAVVRAVQDMKAAIRFFRQNIAGGNTYRIHPNYIYAGGSSAGAFTALHLAYLDSTEVPSWFSISTLGGLEGNSGNPGYPSNVNGVISLCGAIGDTSWIQPGDVPLVFMHGNVDQTVPYGSALIYIFGFPILDVDGSASIKQRADNIGLQNAFHTWWGADHVPYAGTTTAALAYMDSTIDFIKSFLRPQLGGPLAVTEAEKNQTIHVYPNPSGGNFYVEIESGFTKQDVQMFDATGRNVKTFHLTNTVQQLDVSDLKSGIYFLKLINNSRTVYKKLIIE
jgi:hypothetical protein